MQQILIYIFMALGLSMDAFSLAIAYGANGFSKQKIIFLSILVGIFHFFMPRFGSMIGLACFQRFIVHTNLMVGIIFLLLAIEMIRSLRDSEIIDITNFISMIIFAFTVSVDSFSVGIALSITKTNIFLPSLIFAGVSCFFTGLGLFIGKYLNEKFGKWSVFLGIIILLFLSLKYFFVG